MTATISPPVRDAIAFTAPEKSRLKQAAADIERLEGKLAEVEDIRSIITAAEADFVSGKLDITAAAGILSVTGDVNARNALQMRLRSPIKQAIKASIAGVNDLLRRADESKVEALAAQAKELEKAERDSFKEYGLPDEFKASELLRAIRERHRRSLENSKVATYSKASLLAAVE